MHVGSFGPMEMPIADLRLRTCIVDRRHVNQQALVDNSAKDWICLHSEYGHGGRWCKSKVLDGRNCQLDVQDCANALKIRIATTNIGCCLAFGLAHVHILAAGTLIFDARQ